MSFSLNLKPGRVGNGGGYTASPFLFKYSATDNYPSKGGTFSRPSTATRRTVAGTIEEVPTDMLRAPHYVQHPVSGVYVPTALLEGQRTNLCSRSIPTSDWASFGGGTLITEAGIAPDGGDAVSIVEDSSSDGRGIYLGWSHVNGVTHTYSAYLKSEGRPWVDLTVLTGALITRAWFNTETGVKGTALEGITSHSIEDAGNGWHRCSITFVTAGTTGNLYISPRSANDNPDAYAGEPGAKVSVWGVQVEQAPSASSYIPTNGSTVTRAADSLSFPFPHKPTKMSAYVRRMAYIDTGNRGVWHIGSAANTPPKLQLFISGTSHSAENNTGSGFSLATVDPTFLNGDQVEALVQVSDDGVTTVTTSVNGGEPISNSGGTVTLADAFSDQRLYINSLGSAEVGFSAYRDIIFAEGARSLDWFSARVSQ